MTRCLRLIVVYLVHLASLLSCSAIRRIPRSVMYISRPEALTRPLVMAHSLSSECTPLKQSYDSCFNTWFEGYLEPAIAHSRNTPQGQRSEYAKQKAEEFEEKCGGIWDQYKKCVQVSTTQAFHTFDFLMVTTESCTTTRTRGLAGTGSTGESVA